MELSMVDKVLKKYPGQRIDWFNWGEPLLHKEFLTITEMVKGSLSCISTNFSLKLSDDYFEAMQNFNIVIVSMSGITPEVYNLYHRGGQFDLVMGNIEKLAAKKRTRLVIRYLLHKDNQHQLQQATDLFGPWGYEVEPVPLNCEVEDLIAGFEHPYLRPKIRYRRPEFRCTPINRPTFDVEGNHLLCCTSHNVKIGLTIDDNVSGRQLIRAKMKTDLCQTCQKNGYWRMWT
jgi:hypothetical protein